MRTIVLGAIALLGRLRAERVPALLLAVLVAVTAFAFAGGPALFNVVADAGLRDAIVDADPVDRTVQLGEVDVLHADDDPLAAVLARGAELEASLPSTVRSIVERQELVVDTPQWQVVKPIGSEAPPQPSFITFRIQPGAAERIEFVDGGAPGAEWSIVDVPRSATAAGTPVQGPMVEVAFSAETANELGMVVGDEFYLVGDAQDPLVGAMFQGRMGFVVAGIYEVLDPDDPFWTDDTALERPSILPITIDTSYVFATALVAEGAYEGLLATSLPFRYAWRHQMSAEDLDGGRLEQLVADLRRMETAYPPFTSGNVAHGETTLQSGLLRVVNDYLAQRRTAESMLAVVAVGPIAVAAAALGLVVLLVVSRRQAATRLARARGASIGQLLWSQALEAAAIALPSAGFAYLAVNSAVGGRFNPLSPIAAAAVAATLVALMVGATLPHVSPAGGGRDRELPALRPPSPRRLTFEGLAVVLAVGGVLLLRQRGLATSTESVGIDPLLTAVPVLIGVAAGLVTVRLYAFPVAAAGWLAATGRGLVAAFALRRAARHSDAGALPLIVLLLTVAVGAFSSVMLTTVQRGQDSAAWFEIGADYVIVSPSSPLDRDLQISTVDGVSSVASAHRATATLGGQTGARVQLHAIDTEPYAEMLAGTPAQLDLPTAMVEPVIGPESPVPVAISSAVAASERIRVGDELVLSITRTDAPVRIVAIRDAFPGIAVDARFVVAPREAIAAAFPERAFFANLIYVRATARTEAALATAVADEAPFAAVESRYDRIAELHGSPLVEAVAGGFGLALGISLAYAMLAMVASLALASLARAREVAHLRTMGVTRRQLIGLAFLEHGPPLAVAVICGAALGIGVAWVTQPALGLAAFIGSDVAVRPELEPGHLVGLAAALIGLVVVSTALGAWVARWTNLAAAVRQGLDA